MHDLAARAGPTPAHRALAAAGASVVPQNIDGLHQLAGSADVVELHGSAGRARCLSGRCGWAGSAAPARRGPRPRCPVCAEPARPDVVLFGEPLDPAALDAARRLAAGCDLFLAVGTSGRVAPASWLAPTARAAGAYCVNIDLHPRRRPRPRLPHPHRRRRPGRPRGVGALRDRAGSGQQRGVALAVLSRATGIPVSTLSRLASRSPR
jgi:NAD-dependent SIR2 family protein deacetylase